MAGMTNINLDNDNDIPKIPRLHKVAALMKNLNNWATQPRELSDQSRFQKWKQKFRSGQVIDPSQKGQYQWIKIVSVAVLYNYIFIIARSSFWQLQNSMPIIWMLLDGLSDLIYFLDIIVHSHEAYLEDGLMVTKLNKLRFHYLHSSYFIMDVLSLIPLDSEDPEGGCQPHSLPCSVVFRFNKLLRLHRLMEFLRKTEGHTNSPNAFEIFKLVFYICLAIHWNACLYFWMSYYVGFGSDHWVYPDVSEGGPASTLANQYSYSLYWSTLILTMISEVTLPFNDQERVFIIVELLVGVILFAVIVGNVGSIIINMTAAKTDFQNDMDKIKDYLKLQKLPKGMVNRVTKWFDYLITNKQVFNEDRVIQNLPDKLKMEIAMSLHLGTLKRIEMFQDCDPGLLTELVLKLKLQIFSPGDYICRKGDVGKEMYIVKKGEVRVVSDDGKIIFVTLKSGSVFGEISLLSIPGSKTGNRRTANVKSPGYSHLFCLSKDDLYETLREYPEAQTALVERGKTMLKQSGLLDEDAINKKPVLGTDQRLNNLEALLKILVIRLDRLSACFHGDEVTLNRRLGNLEKETASWELSSLPE